jgi:hypothetical protein
MGFRHGMQLKVYIFLLFDSILRFSGHYENLIETSAIHICINVNTEILQIFIGKRTCVKG